MYRSNVNGARLNVSFENLGNFKKRSFGIGLAREFALAPQVLALIGPLAPQRGPSVDRSAARARTCFGRRSPKMVAKWEQRFSTDSHCFVRRKCARCETHLSFSVEPLYMIPCPGHLPGARSTVLRHFHSSTLREANEFVMNMWRN